MQGLETAFISCAAIRIRTRILISLDKYREIACLHRLKQDDAQPESPSTSKGVNRARRCFNKHSP